jgi:putative ABC transport system substrate-binding protein
VSVLSLAPDPALMFARLKDLMPAVRRVHVVYDPRHNAWLLRLAREAARTRSLELVTHEASDLRAALRHYQEILTNVDPRTDALWLPQDATTVEDSSVLPMVLQQAWNRSLVVFSSNVAHVQRGALFALYPDNVELGRNLASSALGVLGAGAQESRAVVPLKDVLLAVNLRTANHLGLRLSYEQQRRFDLVFPQQ